MRVLNILTQHPLLSVQAPPGHASPSAPPTGPGNRGVVPPIRAGAGAGIGGAGAGTPVPHGKDEFVDVLSDEDEDELWGEGDATEVEDVVTKGDAAEVGEDAFVEVEDDGGKVFVDVEGGGSEDFADVGAEFADVEAEFVDVEAEFADVEAEFADVEAEFVDVGEEDNEDEDEHGYTEGGSERVDAVTKGKGVDVQRPRQVKHAWTGIVPCVCFLWWG